VSAESFVILAYVIGLSILLGDGALVWWRLRRRAGSDHDTTVEDRRRPEA